MLRSMGGYTVLYSISLAVYAFGAMAFSALALSYWRERRLGGDRPRSAVLAAFTIVCAAAFLLGLIGELNPPPVAADARDLLTGMIPPLLVHLMYSQSGLRRGGWAVAVFYAASAGLAVTAEFRESF